MLRHFLHYQPENGSANGHPHETDEKYWLAGITRGVGSLSAKHHGIEVPIAHTVKMRCILYESVCVNTEYLPILMKTLVALT